MSPIYGQDPYSVDRDVRLKGERDDEIPKPDLGTSDKEDNGVDEATRHEDQEDVHEKSSGDESIAIDFMIGRKSVKSGK